MIQVHIQFSKRDQRWQVLPSAAPVCPSFAATDAGYGHNLRTDHATGKGVVVHRC